MFKVNLTMGVVISAIYLMFTGSVGCEETALDILNTENQNISIWYEGWADEPIEASIQIKEGKALIEGKSSDKAFGSVHKNITVDLDKYPVIEIDVESVNYYWYLLVSGEQFKFDPANPKSGDSYLLLQEAANKTGEYRYDLEKISGLSGEQRFDLQLGVGKHVGDGNIGCKAAIKSLKFVRSN